MFSLLHPPCPVQAELMVLATRTVRKSPKSSKLDKPSRSPLVFFFSFSRIIVGFSSKPFRPLTETSGSSHWVDCCDILNQGWSLPDSTLWSGLWTTKPWLLPVQDRESSTFATAESPINVAY
eukprot:TRINITY_DN17675_c0_g2_i1.p1 TRINITY_DN17675_c0_g2~~TRINITY_DN17675_c0_g2_i1.p1  ORF type:complete len:122 (-),score=2.62 TRINITY_DN17675_c0_g2_i1:93-458(-)